MHTRSYTTIVVVPGNSQLEVTYYCMDSKLSEKEKENQTQLVIQLHDCVCTLKIKKTTCNKPRELETMVHNKVISTKGYLC